MLKPARIGAQVCVYAIFAGLLGYLSVSPSYTRFDPAMGMIKLSFSHAGQPKTECRRLTQEQLNELAPNMRKAVDCPRERVSLLVELEVDNELVYRDFLPPSGIAGDGASTAYQSFPVEAGPHSLEARLRDSRREQGFDWTMARKVEVRPGKSVVIDFRAETGGFKIL
jgi:hypothetical protein